MSDVISARDDSTGSTILSSMTDRSSIGWVSSGAHDATITVPFASPIATRMWWRANSGAGPSPPGESIRRPRHHRRRAVELEPLHRLAAHPLDLVLPAPRQLLHVPEILVVHDVRRDEDVERPVLLRLRRAPEKQA